MKTHPGKEILPARYRICKRRIQDFLLCLFFFFLKIRPDFADRYFPDFPPLVNRIRKRERENMKAQAEMEVKKWKKSFPPNAPLNFSPSPTYSALSSKGKRPEGTSDCIFIASTHFSKVFWEFFCVQFPGWRRTRKSSKEILPPIKRMHAPSQTNFFLLFFSLPVDLTLSSICT